MIKHERFNKKTVDNDIMLLKLAKPLVYSTTVSPVCLPSKSFTDASYDKMGIVMGYGKTSNAEYGAHATALRHVQLPILSPQKCRTFPGYNTVTDNLVCTYTNGKDNCGGDSGGPLVFEKNGRLTQVGIVSWGGQRCAGHNMPAAYVRVENYMDWIKKHTKEDFCFN